MEIDEAEMDLNTSRSSSRSRRNSKLNISDLNVSWTAAKGRGESKETNELNNYVLSSENTESEEESEKTKISVSKSRGNKSRSAVQNTKSKVKGILKKGSSSESQEEASEIESGKSSSELSKGRGRRGKKPAVDENKGIKTTSEESEETSEVEQRLPTVKSRKSVRESSRNNKIAVSKTSNQCSDDCEKVQETEIIAPAKGRRGRQALKSKEKDAVTKMSEQSSSEENEKLRETEININISTKRGRRGKQAASKNKEKENVFKPEDEVNETVQEEELKAPSDIPVAPKGRSATGKSFVKPSDPPPVSNTRRGRSTAKEEGKATRVSRKPAGRKTLNERISESDSSVSPVRVIPPVQENSDDDDLDEYTPVARPTKSSARRKTLLPSLEETSSEAVENVKGNASRAKSKRKTISGVSDLASVAPSKRLKTSSSQMSKAIMEDEVAIGDDNLLGKNDSYSDWIVLKNVDGKIPTGPAIYEVKVWRAKKTAYIGSCESLRHMLTLHKLKQNSGHKHLDKFIERNYNDIQVRFEVVSSLNEAKAEVKNRINNFVAQHKTTPAYN